LSTLGGHTLRVAALLEIIERWKREGLKEEILIKLKDKIISDFGKNFFICLRWI
jgi:hypothetical protein